MAKFKLENIAEIIKFSKENRDKIIDLSNQNDGKIWFMNMTELFFKELLQGKICYAAFDWDYNIINLINNLKTSENKTIRYITILHPLAVYYIRYDDGLYHIRERYQSNKGYWD